MPLSGRTVAGRSLDGAHAVGESRSLILKGRGVVVRTRG
jgi:hypothetical protein